MHASIALGVAVAVRLVVAAGLQPQRGEGGQVPDAPVFLQDIPWATKASSSSATKASPSSGVQGSFDPELPILPASLDPGGVGYATQVPDDFLVASGPSKASVSEREDLGQVALGAETETRYPPKVVPWFMPPWRKPEQHGSAPRPEQHGTPKKAPPPRTGVVGYDLSGRPYHGQPMQLPPPPPQNAPIRDPQLEWFAAAPAPRPQVRWVAVDPAFLGLKMPPEAQWRMSARAAPGQFEGAGDLPPWQPQEPYMREYSMPPPVPVPAPVPLMQVPVPLPAMPLPLEPEYAPDDG